MPWPVKDLIIVRREFVTLAGGPDANVRQLCRRFGISPTTAYKWLKRQATGEPAALANRSRRPRHSPNQTLPEVEQVIVALRQRHPAWGARKLQRRLQDLGCVALPAASTITGILHRQGLISPAQSQASTPFHRFERSQPNELWQIDFKGHFPLKQGRCHPLCAVDDHSRYNVLLQACAHPQEHVVQTHLINAFRRHGLPDAVLWDNGSPWGSGQGDYSTLDVWLLRLGVRVSHGRPYHPQTQGKEERFHRTLATEVLQQGGWIDCPHVQQEFDRWQPVYNTERPHQALGMATPAQRYRPSQRDYPESLPPVQYDVGIETRRVDAAGWISYQGRPWKMGRAFIGQTVGLRSHPAAERNQVIFLTQVIKELDLRQNQSMPVPKPA